MEMKECGHRNGHPEWDFWQCHDCGWIKPSGQHRGPNNRGFFPSMDAVKLYDKLKTYPGMGDVKPMVPNAIIHGLERSDSPAGMEG